MASRPALSEFIRHVPCKKTIRLKDRLLDYLTFFYALKWCRQPLVEPNLITSNAGRWSKTSRLKAQQREKEWGNKMTGQTNNGQWTTKLGERLVREVLERGGERVWRPDKRTDGGIGLRPDWETHKYIWEVKTQNWCVSGTAGEKILGVPWKYSSVPRLYRKPLKIVCVAYQEHEARNRFQLFGNGSALSEERKKQKKMWQEMGIEFIPFTDLLDKQGGATG